jgi:hypothetical protein
MTRQASFCAEGGQQAQVQVPDGSPSDIDDLCHLLKADLRVCADKEHWLRAKTVDFGESLAQSCLGDRCAIQPDRVLI